MLENWRSRDVQRDPAGFLKAQSARAKAVAARREIHQSRMRAV